MTTPNESPIYPFEINDFPHELTPKPKTGYPHPDDNTDMLDGQEIFPDDIETAKEVH